MGEYIDMAALWIGRLILAAGGLWGAIEAFTWLVGRLTKGAAWIGPVVLFAIELRRANSRVAFRNAMRQIEEAKRK